jgi:hypothetical protein
MFLFVDLLKPFMLFIRGVKIQAPSTWNVNVDYISIEGFDVSMATSFVRPSKKWANTSMSFSGGRTSLPNQAKNGFAHGYALEHTTTLIHLCHISIAQMEEHSILTIWNNIISKLAFHLP